MWVKHEPNMFQLLKDAVSWSFGNEILFSLSVHRPYSNYPALALDSFYPVVSQELGKLIHSQRYSCKSPQSTKK